MKLLYSHRTKSADGQYVHIKALSDALIARGVDLAFCGPGADAGAKKTLSAGAGGAGPAKRSAPLQAGYELAELGYSLLGAARMRRLAAAFTPDVIYERYNLFYHAGVHTARARRLPLILEVNAPLADERVRHGDLQLLSLARWSEGAIWRAADAVLPVTGVLAERVIAAGVAPEKITVIQNGVDDDFLGEPDGAAIRAQYGLAGKLVLGFTGFVRDWHGVDRVLDFMAQAERSDLALLLVGDGPARAPLQAQAERLGLADRFHVTGVVQRDAVAAHVAAFDIALQPAVVAYASPLKLFEYMALSKPILAPASANIEEVLTHGEDGLLFDERPDALAIELTKLVEDGDLRDRLGAAARASLLRQGLTWAHNAERVEKIAERLLAGASRTSR